MRHRPAYRQRPASKLIPPITVFFVDDGSDDVLRFVWRRSVRSPERSGRRRHGTMQAWPTGLGSIDTVPFPVTSMPRVAKQISRWFNPFHATALEISTVWWMMPIYVIYMYFSNKQTYWYIEHWTMTAGSYDCPTGIIHFVEATEGIRRDRCPSTQAFIAVPNVTTERRVYQSSHCLVTVPCCWRWYWYVIRTERVIAVGEKDISKVPNSADNIL